MKRQITVCSFFFVMLGCLAQSSLQGYADKAAVIRSNITSYFKDSSTGFYWETDVTGKRDHYSYLWPLCGLLQAANECEDFFHSDGLFDSVLHCIRNYYDSSGATPAYGASIIKHHEDDRFYDDNQWIAIACLDAFERTHRQEYLRQAKMIYRFMMSGFDTAAGGGLYWKEGNHTTKNTCSNGPGIIVALQLYRATSQTAYLDTALLLYNWTRRMLRSPEGLYYDHVRLPDASIDRRTFTYNTGTMMQCAVLLFRVSGDSSYLHEAQSIAGASLTAFFRDGRFPGNYWFNAVLLRGYMELYKMDHHDTYINAMKQYGDWVWERARDNRGLLGEKNEKSLLDQAAMLELYTRLGRLQ